MKNLLTLLITLLITLSSLAQQGINYKAVVKDGDGNLVIGQTIGVQFTILEGAVIKYVENHTTTMTDTNGIVILNIGQGTATTGTFGAIDWSKTTTLKTEIDIDGGLDNLADLGTTQFMAVPYALNVTGLEQITENNIIDKTGWRLIGEDEIGYYPIGEKAVDLSITNSTSNNFGAIGDYSFAAGFDTGAIGIYSVALKGTANGFSSVALGAGSSANGIFSTAMSLTTTADALASTAMGRLNVGGGDGINWIETDALFEIGNGEYVEGIPVKSNALTVLKNGTITAPSFDISEITEDKALVTKEYVDTNLPEAPTGLKRIVPIGGFLEDRAWRLIFGGFGYTYDSLGIKALDLSRATGLFPIYGASGDYSTALGHNNIASGNYSTTMGSQTTARAAYETAIGRFTTNEIPLDSLFWNANDRLFVIGNGQSDAARSNALTVLKNGTITAPSLTNALINTAGNKALVTKEYTDANYLKLSSNMIPIAYGSVSSTGSILGGSGNFSVTYNSGDTTYTIFVNNEPVTANNSAGIVTVNTSTFRTANTTYDGINMIVHIFLSNGNKVQSPFQFVLYKE